MLVALDFSPFFSFLSSLLFFSFLASSLPYVLTSPGKSALSEIGWKLRSPLDRSWKFVVQEVLYEH